LKRILLLLLLFAVPAFGQTTYVADSCSYADVKAKVDLTVAGDTVTIPACTQTNWTSKLNIGCITLEGTGDAVGEAAGAGTHTVIGDDAGINTPLIAASCNTPNKFRLRNIETVGVGATHFSGVVTLSGTASNIRVDHMRFTSMRSKGIKFGNDSALQGIIDNNLFNFSGKIGIEVHHGGFGGATNGDGSWSTASDFSGDLSDYIVIEDNTFDDSGTAVGPGAIDMFDGSRVIFRYNTLNDLTGHGTDSSGRRRGQRIAIIHNNTFVPLSTNHDSAIIYRGGTGLNYSNIFQKTGSLYYKNNPIKLQNFRDNDSFATFGVCAGYGNYDQNDAGNPFVTGAATAGSVAGTLEDTTKDFTTACSGGNCGTGDYSIRNVTQGWGAAISSVTATTATNVGSAFGQSRAWSPGDSYEILKAYPCIDQVGRGAGDAISGTPPTPTGWVNEVLEPVYSFDDTNENNSSAKEARAATIHINSARDFLNEVSGFDGTSGVGVGTIAARSATCTLVAAGDALVGYWATDEKKFYRCTATDTWTLYYTEAVYPYCVNEVGPGTGTGCDQGAPPTGPVVNTNPNSLSFGNQSINTTSGNQTITLTNTGDASLTITSIAAGGTDSSQFNVSDDCGASLAASASCTITVSFAPTSTGAKSANVTITTNASTSPDTRALSGTGISKLNVILLGVPVP